MDLAEPLLPTSNASAASRTMISTCERDDLRSRPYTVMFLSIDGAVPGESAVRLLSRYGGTMFRAFNGDLNAHRSVGPYCFARDSRHADFVIYLHNATNSYHAMALPPDSQCLHWNISGVSGSSDPKEQERSRRRTETELETRIKLFVLVYERENRKTRMTPVPSCGEPSATRRELKHLCASEDRCGSDGR